MRKIITNIGVIFIMLIVLLLLTGCEENTENNVISTNKSITTNVINETNNVDTNISEEQNIVKNEVNTTKNETQQTNETSKPTTTNTENKTNTSKNETQTNTSKNEQEPVNNTQKNETITETKTETTQEKPSFKVGEYVIHYGTYEGNGSKFVDTKMEFATITIELKENGTYTYKSTNQLVSEDCSGTFSVKNNNVIILNASEDLEYTVLGDDYFIERQGTGFLFNYKEN